MDHPCYKCGQNVEDGKAFCVQCGAPQIRVAMPEAVAAAGAVSPDLPIFPADSFTNRDITGGSQLRTEIAWARAFRACAVAASIAILITALRLAVPLLAVLGAGCLSVIFYRTRNPAWRANARSGAQLGALGGLLFSAISGVFAALVVVLLQAGGEVRQQMIDGLQQVASRSNDPQMQAALEFLKTPEGLAVKVMAGVALVAVLSIAVGGVAGALTASLLGRRNRGST